MTQQSIPETMPVPFAQMVNLAVEYWRLSKWLESASKGLSAGPARHALRKLEDFLKQHEFDVQQLDGRSFDPGLAAKVIDTVEDPMLAKGTTIISETLSPMVFWRGQVVRAAEVVTSEGRAKR